MGVRELPSLRIPFGVLSDSIMTASCVDLRLDGLPGVSICSIVRFSSLGFVF